MPTLTLLIDGQEADYFDRDDFPLVLRRQSVDYKDPAARKGETSFTVKLPNTSANKRILGPLYTLAQTGKFRTGDAPRCAVYVGDTRIIAGRFVIRAVTHDEIEGFITAAVSDFAADMKGRSLRDLNLAGIDFKGWLTMLDNIAAQRYNLGEEVAYGLPYTHTEAVVCFPVVSYGNPFLPNRWTAGLDVDVTDWSPVYGETFALPSPKEIYGRDTYKLELASSFHLGFQDVPPCVYVVEILKAMFAAAGWTLRGAWLNSEAARRLVMPYVGDRPYIYNWEILGEGDYDSGPFVYPALTLNASQDNDANLFGLRVKVWSFEKVVGHIRSYIQSYYKTSIPLGGTVNLPTNGGGQLLDNWRTNIRVLPLVNQVQDYGFMRHTRRFATNPGDNPNEPGDGYRSDLYVAPIDGLYTITNFSIGITTLDTGTLRDDANIVTPYTWNTDINGLRFAVGISKIPGGGDIPAALDGEFTIRQDLTGPGAENVIAAQVVTGPAVHSFSGYTVRLNRGDALAFWVAMTSPYAPDAGADPRETPRNFVIKTGPYTPFEAADPYSFQASVEYKDVAVHITCANLPETPVRDRFGALLNPGQNLPDVQQLDFLKSLISLFNLWLDVNPDARTVTLQTADDFFLPLPSAHDLTDKAGPKTFGVRPPDLPKNVRFVWTKDADDFLTAERGANYDVEISTQLSGATDTAEVSSGIFASTEFADYRLVKAAFDVPDFLNIDFGDTPYTVDDDMFYGRVNVDAAGGAVTVKLPAAPVGGQRISVKDYYGFAASNNITVDGNGSLIDGAGTRTLDVAFVVEEYVYEGPDWTVAFADTLNDAWATPAFVPVASMRVPVLADKDALFRLQNEEGAPNYAHEPRLLTVWDSPLTNPASYTEGVPVRVFDPAAVPDKDYLDRLQNYIQLNFAEARAFTLGAPQPTLAWNGDAGLYALFYRDLYAALARGYEAEAAFRLTAADWLRMSVNRPLVYDGVVYYLKEIKGYNPLNDKLTNVTLIKR